LKFWNLIKHNITKQNKTKQKKKKKKKKQKKKKQKKKKKKKKSFIYHKDKRPEKSPVAKWRVFKLDAPKVPHLNACVFSVYFMIIKIEFIIPFLKFYYIFIYYIILKSKILISRFNN